jgi:predicted MFS family arabinose efflux permease
MSKYRRVIFFLAFSHFIIHVYTQVIPALLPTLKNEFGITLLQASYLLSIPIFVNVIAYLPAGIIADRFGSKVLALCFISTGVGAIIIALSNNYLLLSLGAVLLGLGSTLYHPPSLKTASLVDPSRINLAMSFHLAGGTTGIALGPISLGLLIPFIGWRRALLIWVPFQALLTYISFRFTNDDDNMEQGEPFNFIQDVKSIISPEYLLVIAAGGFLELTVVNISGFMTTYLNLGLGLSESLSSLIFGLGPLAGIIGAFGGGRIGDNYGNYNALLGILIATILLLVALPTTKIIALASLIYIVYRSLVAASMPLFNNLVATNSETSNRSLAFSFYFMVSNMGASVMPIITSLLAEERGISVLFPLSVVLLTPSVLLLFLLKKRK